MAPQHNLRNNTTAMEDGVVISVMQQLHRLSYLKVVQKATLEAMTKEDRKEFYSVFKLNKNQA
jgi:hypothetical protein